MIERKILTTAFLIALQTGACLAEDGCDKFAWPLTREQALLSAPDKANVKAGETLPAAPKGAFVLNLQPNSEATLVAYALPPERKPKAETWFGGIVRLAAVEKPGVYQVTLSEEAWLDVVQVGHYAHTVGFSGRHDCPGVRKSLRFELGATPFALQISGAAADKISIVIGPRD
jgi:hypothetical protein